MKKNILDEISITTATKDDINTAADFLFSVNDLFTIPLTERIDIPSYVEKLLNNGYLLKAVYHERIVSLAAFYANDNETKISFLSMLAVSPDFHGCGIAGRMLDSMFIICKKNNMKKQMLYVYADNKKAINRYKKSGFDFDSAVDTNDTNHLRMTKYFD